MSKTKRQKPHKNRKKIPKSLVKKNRPENKIYRDEFLGKEIELSKSPYEVFSENHNLSSGNQMVVRQVSDTVISDSSSRQISKTKDDNPPLEFPKTENEMKEVLTQLDPENSGKSMEEIFQQIKQEKAIFEAKLEGGVKNKVEKQEKTETIFDHIYTKEFANIGKKKSFFGQIIDVFNNEIVWTSVAISMVLAAILFYFQALQPTILYNYSVSAKSRINSLTSKYSDQVGKYFDFQTKISSSFNYSPGALCSTFEEYQNVGQDGDELSRVNFTLVPDSTYSRLNNYLYFYLPEIREVYDEFYKDYQNKMNVYLEDSRKMQDIIRFLDYRNSWIRACKTIENSNERLDLVNQACVDITKSQENFEFDGIPYFWSEIEGHVVETLNACKTLSQATLNEFIKNFYLDFDSVMFYRPVFEESNQKLTELNQVFIGVSAPQARRKIDQISEKKFTFTGMWYLIGIEL